MTRTQSQNEITYGAIVRAAFKRHGLPVEWGMAIAWVETGGTFNPNLVNMTGGDLARGGSYGLMQMSLRTAKDLGYTGTGLDLCQTETCTDLAAKLFVQNAVEVGQDFSKLAAAYNCGTHHVQKGTIPDSTKHYVSLAVPHMEHYTVQYGGENVCVVPALIEALVDSVAKQIEIEEASTAGNTSFLGGV